MVFSLSDRYLNKGTRPTTNPPSRRSRSTDLLGMAGAYLSCAAPWIDRGARAERHGAAGSTPTYLMTRGRLMVRALLALGARSESEPSKPDCGRPDTVQPGPPMGEGFAWFGRTRNPRIEAVPKTPVKRRGKSLEISRVRRNLIACSENS